MRQIQERGGTCTIPSRCAFRGQKTPENLQDLFKAYCIFGTTTTVVVKACGEYWHTKKGKRVELYRETHTIWT